jgi:hypothetical protein
MPSPRPRAAQGSDARGAAKTRDGNVEAMRVLRSSACKGRAQALNQIRNLISTGPEVIPPTFATAASTRSSSAARPTASRRDVMSSP